MNRLDVYYNIFHKCKVGEMTYKRKAKNIYECNIIKNNTDRFLVNINESLVEKYEKYLEENEDSELLYSLFDFAKHEENEVIEDFKLLDNGIYTSDEMYNLSKKFEYLYQKGAESYNTLLPLREAYDWFYMDEYILVGKERKIVDSREQIITQKDIDNVKEALQESKDISLIKMLYHKYIGGIGENFETKEISIRYKNEERKWYDSKYFYDNYVKIIENDIKGMEV